MTLQEILLGGGVGCACLLLLVQLSPLKINPWSALWKGLKWLWKAFTRSLNADVLDELATLKTGQQETKDKLEESAATTMRWDLSKAQPSINKAVTEIVTAPTFSWSDWLARILENLK